MYNLGFLPGGNKEITTLAKTTMKSIEDGLELLDSNGIMTIAVYRGHAEGKNRPGTPARYPPPGAVSSDRSCPKTGSLPGGQPRDVPPPP